MKRWSKLLRDESGATLVEFALVSPFLLVLLLGTLDLGHTMYTNAILTGAIQKAARGSTIEGAATNDLDAKVTQAVQIIMPGATTTFKREAYRSFTAVKNPEEFVDATAPFGVCNTGEAFEDANDNGVWDADAGRAGNGGARDSVRYIATVNYNRLLPVGTLLGQPNTIKMSASTILRNQPYSLQGTPKTLTCL